MSIPRAAERFERITHRLRDALERDDLTFAQWGLVTYLIAKADPRTGEVVMTTRALADAIGWEQSPDKLMKDLYALRPEWIDFEVRQGQRRSVVFRLTGAAVATDLRPTSDPLPTDFRQNTPSPAEVSSDGHASVNAATPGQHSDPGVSRLPTPAQPRDETETKTETTPKAPSRDGAKRHPASGQPLHRLVALAEQAGQPVTDDDRRVWIDAMRGADPDALDRCVSYIERRHARHPIRDLVPYVTAVLQQCDCEFGSRDYP